MAEERNRERTLKVSTESEGAGWRTRTGPILGDTYTVVVEAPPNPFSAEEVDAIAGCLAMLGCWNGLLAYKSAALPLHVGPAARHLFAQLEGNLYPYIEVERIINNPTPQTLLAEAAQDWWRLLVAVGGVPPAPVVHEWGMTDESHIHGFPADADIPHQTVAFGPLDAGGGHGQGSRLLYFVGLPLGEGNDAAPTFTFEPASIQILPDDPTYRNVYTTWETWGPSRLAVKDIPARRGYTDYPADAAAWPKWSSEGVLHGVYVRGAESQDPVHGFAAGDIIIPCKNDPPHNPPPGNILVEIGGPEPCKEGDRIGAVFIQGYVQNWSNWTEIGNLWLACPPRWRTQALPQADRLRSADASSSMSTFAGLDWMSEIIGLGGTAGVFADSPIALAWFRQQLPAALAQQDTITEPKNVPLRLMHNWLGEILVTIDGATATLSGEIICSTDYPYNDCQEIGIWPLGPNVTGTDENGDWRKPDWWQTAPYYLPNFDFERDPDFGFVRDYPIPAIAEIHDDTGQYGRAPFDITLVVYPDIVGGCRHFGWNPAYTAAVWPQPTGVPFDVKITIPPIELPLASAEGPNHVGWGSTIYVVDAQAAAGE